MDNELREKLTKAGSQDEVAELLKAEGQDASDAGKIWKEISEKHQPENKALSLDELDAVSGGTFWFGNTAPDGHELDCFCTWYDGWDGFDAANAETYCPGSKGKKHIFGNTTGTEQGLLGESQFTNDTCKRCGYVRTSIPV